ncbi:HAMP domain-containing protein [Agrobacterium rubi]|uniref:HAMP domain-containing protein n=2 Tax=Agrobacterium rubi TaxID=28099 RepID=A0AAE7R2F9_9HYPH|nr:HAMP domain-containing methyl-accepting chemotaxis protein [Agrobacterium rubi]NTE85633.1 HAMP domain-containing protein [Agrobacterium rubi]NTF01565.1 HAMP domain-containing protein [Agrobacterium rubi]NTF35808.1 HAMP domain-containing protein [Agrobacterium rubi]OCJ48296.1 chemotaxis protein [Agrobacterium rubi]QTG00918.1 HAMP domain-containing protein [Agrobacterium rubi]
MSIRSKLLSCIFFLVAILAVTSVFSFYALNEEARLLRSVVADRVIPMAQLKSISDDYAVKIVDTVHKVSGGSLTVDQGIQNIRGAMQNIDKSWKDYTATYLTVDEKRLADEFQSMRQSADQKIQGIITLLQAGNLEEIGNFADGQLYSIIDPLGESVSKLIDIQLTAAKDGMAAGEDLKSFIVHTLAILGAIALALAVVCVLIVIRGVIKPIQRMTGSMSSLASGNVDLEIPGADRKDEIGKMAQNVVIFRNNAIERVRLEQEADANRSMSEKERIAREEQKAKEAADTSFAVDNLADALSRLADGDVSYRISQPFVQHLDVVRANFNSSAEKLQSALNRVADNARGIDAGANEIRAAADDLAKRTEQQAASVEETAAALEQITTTVKDSTKRAQEAGQLVSKARTGAEQSGDVVRKAVIAMEQIEKSSSEISNIISVIDEIAFQTNLLALNAGVEAARAGEAGKGFAVVAQEVRELAQRSANAAKDIKALITTSNGQVQQGVQLVGETGRALETIVAEVQEINRHVVAIVDGAQEQSSGLQQINTAVNQMDQDTQKNAAMVEEQTAASHTLAREAASLNHLLGQFKLGGGYEAPRQATQAERPVQSPARALGRKVASAFNGNAAVKSDWEEF